MNRNIIEEFRLPRYNEIPNVGLYLDQVTKYIDDYLKQIGDATDETDETSEAGTGVGAGAKADKKAKDYTPILTSSMISNYVKKKIIDNPIKKQYYRDQIAYLFFIALAKSVLSLEDIRLMIHLQKMTYSGEKAYNYFVNELENTLKMVFRGETHYRELGEDKSKEKIMLRNTVVAISHKVYLEAVFAEARKEEL